MKISSDEERAEGGRIEYFGLSTLGLMFQNEAGPKFFLGRCGGSSLTIHPVTIFTFLDTCSHFFGDTSIETLSKVFNLK